MRTSAIARLVVMGALTVALFVPLMWVWAIVEERASRRDKAVEEVSTTWGGSQTIAGPVLTIPYSIVAVDSAGRQHRTTRRAHFLPRELRIDGQLNTQRRKRGIFDVIVYEAELEIAGKFARPDVSWLRPTPESIDWENAVLSVGVSDPRGLTRRVPLQFAGREVPFSGGIAEAGLAQKGIQARVGQPELLQRDGDLPFSLTLAANGTRDIRFLPAADETSVQLTARWPHPSFAGSPLPRYETVAGGGFRAHWHAPDFGRSYPSRWSTGDISAEQLQAHAQSSAFGVTLIQPVDIYHQAERAVKYAVLFIVLTFVVFFLWEIFGAALLHPLHYTFVGVALFVFYLLLVSISEHAGFDRAYLASAVVTTLLIAGYARAVLRGTRPGLSVAASLTALYSFLYLLLRLEDYALLAGAIGIFIVLAAVMYMTRRMDWYSLRLGTTEPPAVP